MFRASKYPVRLALEWLEERTLLSRAELVGTTLRYLADPAEANDLSIVVEGGQFGGGDGTDTLTINDHADSDGGFFVITDWRFSETPYPFTRPWKNSC